MYTEEEYHIVWHNQSIKEQEEYHHYNQKIIEENELRWEILISEIRDRKRAKRAKERKSKIKKIYSINNPL